MDLGVALHQVGRMGVIFRLTTAEQLRMEMG